MLLPRADIATDVLVDGLANLGWEVEDIVAYRTVRAAPPSAEIRDMIKSGGFDAVCFTSSSTVRNLVGIAGKPHQRTIIACIGPMAAATARELGLRVDVQPEIAGVDELVDALAEHVAGLRAAGHFRHLGKNAAHERQKPSDSSPPPPPPAPSHAGVGCRNQPRCLRPHPAPVLRGREQGNPLHARGVPT